MRDRVFVTLHDDATSAAVVTALGPGAVLTPEGTAATVRLNQGETVEAALERLSKVPGARLAGRLVGG